MRWAGWLRKKPAINHDYFTRLDCKKLNAMQDGGRNSLILLQAQQKQFRAKLAELSKIYVQIGVAIERLDRAVHSPISETER